MYHRRARCCALIACLTLALALACPAASAPPFVLSLQPHIEGLSLPVAIAHAGDGSGRLFIVEQAGRILLAGKGAPLPDAFLDITDRVRSGGERGLLGLAFPPGYADKGYFYVNYTALNGATTISRFRLIAGDPNRADPASEEILLVIAQPYANHNGGQIAFSPRDGYLYVGMGDGGSGGDPQNRAQNPNELLGKLLRLDVEGAVGSGSAYLIPPTNPYTATVGYRPEIWALGLRNPWRFSFDRQTGDLYIGDVGQGLWEEIDYQPASSAGGQNYGWRIMEGAHCYNPDPCDSTGLTLPIWEYSHSAGQCVTGGYVYRGDDYPDLAGMYVFGDYISGAIWGLRRAGGSWEHDELIQAPFQISAFGEGEDGQLYAAAYDEGAIYRLVAYTNIPTGAPPPTRIQRLYLPMMTKGLGSGTRGCGCSELIRAFRVHPRPLVPDPRSLTPALFVATS